MTAMPALLPGPCAETDPDLFFPEVGVNAPEARELCRPCESRLPCLRWALGNYEHGIWGGTSELERDKIRRRIRAGESLEDIIAADDAEFYARVEEQQEQARNLAAARQARRRTQDRERHRRKRAAERSGQVAA